MRQARVYSERNHMILYILSTEKKKKRKRKMALRDRRYTG